MKFMVTSLLSGWPPGHGTDYAANNWPLRGAMFTMWEGGSKTVAFIHSPKYLTPRVSHSWMHVTDWFPTLLSAAGIAQPTAEIKDLDGLDQWAQLKDSSLESPRTEMVYNIFYPNFPEYNVTGGPPISAIRLDSKILSKNFLFSS